MKLTVPPGARVAASFGNWTLYELPPREGDSFLWMKVKLMMPPNTKPKHGQKSAYWLSWNIADARFARAAVTSKFEAAEPEVFTRVVLYMSLNYTLDLYTPEEIAEEKRRLVNARKEWKAATV